jgi:hypothetical protein
MSYKAANNDYSNYERTILEILQQPIEKFQFLQNQNITGVFGVSKEYGLLYCQSLQEEFPEEVVKIQQGIYNEMFSEFHRVGNPEFFYSDILQRPMNANTVRYFYHALLIKKYMEKKFPGKALQVVEIGGGYGGLCFWLTKLATTSIEKYEIIDLQTALQLQKVCLESWKVSCTYTDNPFSWKKENTTFVISNYGFSEFNQMYQTIYTQTILSKCEGGFMIWNNWTGILDFTKNPIHQEKERPEFPDAYNSFLYF